MNLEDFIKESNKIEGEESFIDKEMPVYEWFLSNDLNEKNLKKFHKDLCIARSWLLPKERGVYRDCPVWIGGREIGHYNIDGLIKDLFAVMPKAFKFHKEYESIHPFVDLNGRTGRAIWLHQMTEGGQNDVPYLGFLHTWYYQSLSHDS